MRTITLSLFLVLFSVITFSQSFAEKEKDNLWNDFRINYPNPYQTIGFAQFDDKSQLYLISEPPPYVNLNDITELFEGFDYSVEVKTWKTGYDGWVKDVLVCVHYIPPVYKLLLVQQLNNLLFANSYKPMYKELPVVQPRRVFIKGNNVDYKISVMELNKWFVEDNIQFNEVGVQNNQYSFNELLNTPKAGVYASNDYTFVVWNIPFNNSTSFSRENIGKFAIESDIILGAISNSKTLIVIGRGRQCSYAELPPLRIETIEMLAGTKDENFSQSLNIAELITGKTETGADWCPAYLSDELENDEFGHILTLTDIFLKDWIENGMLSYPEYHYPKPNYYPFANGLFSNQGSIRYNWNTNDYIYSTYINSNRLITLRNTASLNISLFDDTEIEEKGFASDINKKANDYFAKIQNADVVRAVQYTALYKIFKANNVQYPNYSKSYTKDKSTLLLKDTREIINKLRNLSNSEITNISRKIANNYYNQYLYQDLQLSKEKKHEEWEKDLEKAARAAAAQQGKTYEDFVKSPEYEAKRAENLKRFEVQVQSWFNQSKEQTISEKEKEMYDKIVALRNKLAEIDYSDLEKLFKYVSYPKGNYTSDYSRIRYLSREITKLYWPIWIYGDYFGINMEQVKNDYVKSLTNDNGKWIKTPKIVVTDNKIGRVQVAENKYITIGGAIGGHSLNTPVQNKQADYTEKTRPAEAAVARTTINKLTTTPDEYNYARGTENTPSSNIIHYLPYGSDNDSEATTIAQAHYSAYNNDIKPEPQQNINTANNSNNDAVITRYIEHYDDILKPTPQQQQQPSQNNNVNNNTVYQNTTSLNNTDTRNQKIVSSTNVPISGLSTVVPFYHSNVKYKGQHVTNIESTGNALVDAAFFASMAAANNNNVDATKYYADRAVEAMSGPIGKVPDDPNLSNNLEQVLKRIIKDITKKEDDKRANKLPAKERLKNIKEEYVKVKQSLEQGEIQVITPEQKKTLDNIYNYANKQLSKKLPELEQRIEAVIRPTESQKKEEKNELPKKEEEDLSALEEQLRRLTITLITLKQETLNMENEKKQ